MFERLLNLDVELTCLATKAYLAKEKVVDAIKYDIPEKVEDTVFSGKNKEKALAEHDKKLTAYNKAHEEMNKNCQTLYLKRTEAKKLIAQMEMVINSIANSPKEFNVKMGEIKVALKNFKDTEDYAQKAYQEMQKTQKDFVAGAAAGVGIATMAPHALMGLATTFGTASTGTAISALSGAAAQKAAVAWIGRTFAGVAVKSGAGMLAGQAFLALAGPVGWGITAATTSFSLLKLSKNNQKIAMQAMEETKEIIKATKLVNDANIQIKSLLQLTNKTYDDLLEEKSKVVQYMNADFRKLDAEERKYLGSIVNNTLAMAELLNKSI